MRFGKCQLRSRARLCSGTFSAVFLWSTGDCNLAGAVVQVWCLFASVLEHAHNNTSHRRAVCTDSGREATRHVLVMPPCESRAAALPPGYVAPPGRRGGADDYFFVHFYVDVMVFPLGCNGIPWAIAVCVHRRL